MSEQMKQQSTTDPVRKRLVVWMKEKIVDKVTGGLIVTILVAVATATGAWLWSRSADVRYSIGDFTSHDTETGQVEVTIINKGSALAENLDCEVQVHESELKAITCEPSFMKATVVFVDERKRAVISIPQINGNEKVTIAVRATHPFQFMKSFKFAGRGKNTPVSRDTDTLATSLFKSFLFCVVLPLTAALIVWEILKACMKKWLERISMKVFHFQNGPLAGEFVTWPDSKNYYEKMKRDHTVLTLGETIYFAISKVETNSCFKFDMVCNDAKDAKIATPTAVADVRQTSQDHLL